MKKGDIFWGILLLTLGTLLLFRNFDIFNFSLRSLLRLWPLIFVFWGIAVLPVKQGIKLILVGLTIIAGILILAFSPQHDYRWFDWGKNIDYEFKEDISKETPGEQNFSENYDSTITCVRLDLDAAAGKFYMRDVSQKLFEFNNEGNADPYKITTSYEDSLAVIHIRHKNKIHTHDLDNSAWLSLNQSPVWDINIAVGAAELEADLTSFRVERIDIDGGASKVEMKIGSKYKRTEVNIDAGAFGHRYRGTL